MKLCETRLSWFCGLGQASQSVPVGQRVILKDASFSNTNPHPDFVWTCRPSALPSALRPTIKSICATFHKIALLVESIDEVCEGCHLGNCGAWSAWKHTLFSMCDSTFAPHSHSHYIALLTVAPTVLGPLGNTCCSLCAIRPSLLTPTATTSHF